MPYLVPRLEVVLGVSVAIRGHEYDRSGPRWHTGPDRSRGRQGLGLATVQRLNFPLPSVYPNTRQVLPTAGSRRRGPCCASSVDSVGDP